MQPTRQKTRSWSDFRAIFLPLLFGTLLFLRVQEDPHLQAIRGVDMVRLIGVGFLWGIGVLGLVWSILAKTGKL